MTEASLTQDLRVEIKAAMPFSVMLKHQDRKFGFPDFSLTWHGRTSWTEVKFYNDEPFDSPEIQRLMCRRLAEQGICNYLIYELRGTLRRTLIVHPNQLDIWRAGQDAVMGFDHAWAATFLRKLHTVNV